MISLLPREVAAEKVRTILDSLDALTLQLLYTTLHDGLNLRYDNAKRELKKAGWWVK